MSKHTGMLTIIVPHVIEEIIKRDSVSEAKAIEEFYSSITYKFLEREETGVWHYSPRCLYEIYKSEKETGEPIFPEEV